MDFDFKPLLIALFVGGALAGGATVGAAWLLTR